MLNRHLMVMFEHYIISRLQEEIRLRISDKLVLI